MAKRVFLRREQRKVSKLTLVLAIVLAAIGSGVAGYAAAKLANGEPVPAQVFVD